MTTMNQHQQATWEPSLPPLLAHFEPPGEFWRTMVAVRHATVAHTHGRAWLQAQVAELDGPTIYDQLVAEWGKDA